ncbi:14-3-3-like protein GF14 kappa [Diospyros lotus]|uniref:14-3-3-like protein GF14 kappa n=1 Tax=Diospyros lotus TaxID=55363 RepID=UPI0022506313|nr:14-3-3-like protein GF14 kappa [Diospyros lotus]
MGGMVMMVASTDESEVFYFKMAGDYDQRYTAEFKSESESGGIEIHNATTTNDFANLPTDHHFMPVTICNEDDSRRYQHLHMAKLAEQARRYEDMATFMETLVINFIPAGDQPSKRVFYLKMEGDYQLYMAEFESGSKKMEIAEKARASYLAAEKI